MFDYNKNSKEQNKVNQKNKKWKIKKVMNQKKKSGFI